MNTFVKNEEIIGSVKSTGKNFGFLVTKKGDVFIPPKEFKKVFVGDQIKGKIFFNNNNPQIFVEKVINHAHKEYVGIFKVNESGYYVIPEEKDRFKINQSLRIPKSKRRKASDGDLVKVEIIEYPIENGKPKGIVKKVIGKFDSPNFEANYIFEKNNLPIYFNNEVLDKSSEYDEQFIQQKAKKRNNLSGHPFITIDGENTKDVDDALFCKKTDKGWKLWVAISDVTEFVKENDVIDKEALKRTSSVYTPLRYIPMLPDNLSANLCSLNPDVKRLAFVCYMEISKEGEIQKSDFFEAIIKSKARISYNELEDYMNNNIEVADEKLVKRNVKHLCELHEVLNAYRQKNFLVNPRKDSIRYDLDDNRQVQGVEKTEYKKSNAVVEEMMLLANISAAKFLNENYEKAIYRSNNGFIEEETESFKKYIERQGIKTNNQFKTIEDYKDIFPQILEKDEVLNVLDNFISPSKYSTEPKQHFGLGVNKYTYFTSPIRRYADIIVHRMIKNVLNKKQKVEVDQKTVRYLNDTRQMIEKVTSDVQGIMNCKLMELKKEETHSGFIKKIDKNGMIIKVKNLGITGILPVSLFNEYMDYDNLNKKLSSKNHSFQLGEVISVIVKNIDYDNAEIIFNIA